MYIKESLNSPEHTSKDVKYQNFPDPPRTICVMGPTSCICPGPLQSSQQPQAYHSSASMYYMLGRQNRGGGLGGLQPPQFLTFTRGRFMQIIGCFIASHASPQSYFCSATTDYMYARHVIIYHSYLVRFPGLPAFTFRLHSYLCMQVIHCLEQCMCGSFNAHHTVNISARCNSTV